MQFKKLEVVARGGQIRRERIWTCAACPQGEGHGRPESINHRHADFQDDGEAGSARASRRPGTSFRGADRTALADRAYAEPKSRKLALFFERPNAVNGLRASRPNFLRTALLWGPAGLTCHNDSMMSARGSACLRSRLLQQLGHSRLPARACRLPIGDHFRRQPQ